MSAPTTRSSTKGGVSPTTSQRTGLFIGSWQVGTMLPGAPLLTVHLTFAAPSGSVSGIGQITQAVNPPLDQTSRLDGDYTYLTVMPDTSHILITATGYPAVSWPAHGGTGPIIPANLQLRMVLDADWQRGTATFQYLSPAGAWERVESATAQMAPTADVAGNPIAGNPIAGKP